MALYKLLSADYHCMWNYTFTYDCHVKIFHSQLVFIIIYMYLKPTIVDVSVYVRYFS